MKRSFLLSLMALCIAVPALSQPLTVAPGNDGWKTAPNGSQIDLTVYDLSGLFGAGATFNPAVVPLSGVPLKPALGSYDTLLERFPPSVTFNFIGDVKVVPVEIKALRLRGQVAVNDGVNVTNYRLTVALSEEYPATPGANAGTMTLTLTTPDGGLFHSSFPVIPKLVFEEIGNPANRVELDCGFNNPACPANLTLNSRNNCWLVKGGPNNFNPATKGITPIQAGIAVDGTYNAVNDYTTVGRLRAGFPGKEFHVGFQPAPPWPLCGSSTHDHAVFGQNASKHIAQPAQDCQPTSGSNDTATGAARVRTGAASSGSGTIGVDPVDVEPAPCPVVIGKDPVGGTN